MKTTSSAAAISSLLLISSVLSSLFGTSSAASSNAGDVSVVTSTSSSRHEDTKFELITDVLKENHKRALAHHFSSSLENKNKKASLHLQSNRSRNTEQCTPIVITVDQSELENDDEIRKEILDYFGDSGYNPDAMTLDFSKMPSVLRLYDEKCTAASGSLLTASIECTGGTTDISWKKLPLCVSDCPDSMLDDFEKTLEVGYEAVSGGTCTSDFEKYPDSAASKVALWSSALIGLVVTIVAM